MKRLILSLMLLACAVSFLLSACASSSEVSRRYGNTNGNLGNGGISVEASDWLYFMNYADQNALYRIRADGSGEEKVSSDQGYSLNYLDDWIYFINGSDGNRIYKMNLDGSNKEAVHEDMASLVSVADEWIYYINESRPENTEEYEKIFRVRTDGTQREKITEEKASRFYLYEDQIYYLGGEESKLYRIGMDGTENVLVSEENISSVVLYEDSIYYVDGRNESNTLWKMNLDGSGKTQLSEDKATTINISDGWIYYGNTMVDSFDLELKKIRIDGSEPTRISDDNPIVINIHGSVLLYLDMDFKTFAFKQVILNETTDLRKEYTMMESGESEPITTVPMKETAVTDELVIQAVSAYSTNNLGMEIPGEYSPIFDVISDGTFLFIHLTVESHSGEDVNLYQKLGIIEDIENPQNGIYWPGFADLTSEKDKNATDFHLPRERYSSDLIFSAENPMDLQIYIELSEARFPVYLGIFEDENLTPVIAIEIYPDEEKYVESFRSSEELMALKFPEAERSLIQGLAYQLEGEDQEYLYYLFEVRETPEAESTYFLVRSENGKIYKGAFNEAFPDYPAVPLEPVE